MRLEEARQIIENTLPERRYVHTLGVVETARHLALKYGVNEEEAALAAMLHDYAKYRDTNEMRSIAVELNQRVLLDYDEELLHRNRVKHVDSIQRQSNASHSYRGISHNHGA
ncbi:HD domain-containing protein [uncultured Exiguobacterium sp.]|uniref:HD domain-containing protein n=1 Tax=uncultured Exiguobacterium sp. TaxID=202669 RepID=UPI0025D7A6D4|nr:HD domain-containing protein [uncultured Exiguobacterium sp.]